MGIILTHIPRTGGTTLFQALKNGLPAAKAGEFDSFAELALMSDDELNSFDIISTYIGSRLLDRLRGSWTKVIILRDPIARLKSSYWHLKTSPEGLSFASSLAKSSSFAEYMAARCAAVTFQATNVQTWAVLGDKSLHFREKFATRSTHELLDMATQRLGHYDCIGFTETLDDLWLSLCMRLNLTKAPLPCLRANLAQPDLKASSEDIDFHTSLDSEFIRRARDAIERFHSHPSWQRRP